MGRHKLRKAIATAGLVGALAVSGCSPSRMVVRYDQQGNPHYIRQNGMNNGDSLALAGLGLWGLGVRRNAPAGAALGNKIFQWGVNRSAAEAGRNQINVYNQGQFRQQQIRPVVPVNRFQEVWVDYNSVKNGERGMVIHSKFDVQAQGQDIRGIAYFFWQDGRPLMDNDGRFSTVDGQVASIGPSVFPPYARTTVHDYQIFLPNEQLDIEKRGRSNLKFYIELKNLTANPPRGIVRSPTLSFHLDK